MPGGKRTGWGMGGTVPSHKPPPLAPQCPVNTLVNGSCAIILNKNATALRSKNMTTGIWRREKLPGRGQRGRGCWAHPSGRT